MMMLLPPGVSLQHYEDRHAAISLTVTCINTHAHAQACILGGSRAHALGKFALIRIALN